MEGIDAMRHATDPERRRDLAEQVVDHASKLVPYEEQRLKTTDPEPTRVILQVRAGEIDDLNVQLYQEEDR